MGLGDGGHDADLRFGDPREGGDLPRLVGTHFEHDDLGIIGSVEQRQRQANSVVESFPAWRGPGAIPRSAAWVNSLVPVFPEDPVMPTTTASRLRPAMSGELSQGQQRVFHGVNAGTAPPRRVAPRPRPALPGPRRQTHSRVRRSCPRCRRNEEVALSSRATVRRDTRERRGRSPLEA